MSSIKRLEMSFRFQRRTVQDFLANYSGPYPLDQLRKARDTLIYGFNTYSSHTFHRLHRIMYLENISHDSNWEYSEDEYSESESDIESVMRVDLESKGVNKPKVPHDLYPKQETEQTKFKEQPDCQPESSSKTFYSVSGFKNRFAQYLLEKKTMNVFNRKSFEKDLVGTDSLKVKRKSPETNCRNGKSFSENGNIDDYCDFTPKKAKVGNSDSSESENMLIEGFKCDYCSFTSTNSEETYSHLRIAQHQYASKYKGKLENDKFSPFYIAEEMYLENDQKHFTKIATCPKCFAIFSSIYSCASHSMDCLEYSNSNLEGLYAISDVVRDTNVLIPVDSVCQACNLKCSKHRALNLHYEACNHYPFNQPNSPDILLLFICPYCKKDFRNFFLAKAHVITHAVKQPRVLMALQLIYYKKTVIGQRLLPRQHISVNSTTSVKSLKKKKKARKRYFE